MKLTRTKIIIATSALSLLVATGVAFARGPGGGGPLGFFGGHRLAMLLEDLNLTDQQEDLALDIRKDMKKSARAMRQDMMASMDTVMGELDKPKPDAAKIHSVVDQRFDAMRKLAHSAVDKFLQLHATFSNEQRQQLANEAKRFHKRAKRLQEED